MISSYLLFLAAIFNVAQSLAPWSQVMSIRDQRKSIGGWCASNYHVFVWNSILWQIYSFLTEDTVFLLAFTFQTVFGIFYLLNVVQKSTKQTTLMNLAPALFTVLYFSSANGPLERNVGTICSIFTVLSSALSLAGLWECKRDNIPIEESGLSFRATMSCMLSNMTWSAYGLAIEDPFVTIPNLFAAFLGFFMILGLFYASRVSNQLHSISAHSI